MNSKHILYSIVTALVIVGIYQSFAVGRFSYPEYNLKAGQVADADIIAPFDFPIMKPPTVLAQEKEKMVAEQPKPYYISDEPLFDALSAMDAIYAVFISMEPNWDANILAGELKRTGYNFNPENLGFAFRSTARDRLYETLRAKISQVYQVGIYELLSGDSILISDGDELKTKQKSSYYELETARAELIKATDTAPGFTKELAEQVIKPNLLISETKLNEITQRRLGSIPQSEGIVLQNEVIVRKNARITPVEIAKLESLQEAYRNSSLHKTPLQLMFLTIGLLMFVFIVVSLANHYFGVMSKEDKLLVTDFLPLNLGFVVLVLIASLINAALGYNNLLIPFAMLTLAAAILVSFEYGMLYAICSLLIISPFLNWETYTPIILLLSTVSSLVLIRRQNAWHEYFMIWLFCAVSNVLVIVSISIYKSDPLLSIMRSVGYGLISATLSIAGVFLIVPYYERKWNRATKQTLLELLDFNHPLLKKLATEAVGTYQHSLIVGNLTERAAEAIGANPLLARVGSYYHDIGKVINTEIFTENNEESPLIHAALQPTESADLIRNHVSEGIVLAKKYRIPQPVIDIIMQHHGNSLIRFFFDKATKNNESVDLAAYQYPGPKPQSKEAALVMLADIVESTTKAKAIESEADIANIIDKTIAKLVADKQFDEAPISLKDLKIVKEAFIPILGSIYRKRLDYPDPPKNE